MQKFMNNYSQIFSHHGVENTQETTGRLNIEIHDQLKYELSSENFKKKIILDDKQIWDLPYFIDDKEEENDIEDEEEEEEF
jgi:hypothetical protein